MKSNFRPSTGIQARFLDPLVDKLFAKPPSNTQTESPLSKTPKKFVRFPKSNQPPDRPLDHPKPLPTTRKPSPEKSFVRWPLSRPGQFSYKKAGATEVTPALSTHSPPTRRPSATHHRDRQALPVPHDPWQGRSCRSSGRPQTTCPHRSWSADASPDRPLRSLPAPLQPPQQP